MNKKMIKILIIVLFVLLLLIMLVLKIIKVKKEEAEQQNLVETPNLDSGEEIDPTKVDLYFSEYKNITDCIQLYINATNIKASKYYDKNNNVIDESLIKRNIITTLSDDYIKKNNITEANVYNFVDTIEEKNVIYPISIEKKYNKDVNTFKVTALASSVDNIKDTRELYLIVTIDSENETFAIEPLKSKTELDNYNIPNNIESVTEKSNNGFVTVPITSKVITEEYFSLYKYLLQAKPEMAYELLDDEYKEARFKNYKEFEEYVDYISKRVKKMALNKYGTELDNGEKGYDQYICTNQFNDIIIFNERKAFDFSVILDEYTIDLPQVIENYDNSNEQEKSQLNIGKIKQALNAGNFDYVYSKLSKEFRNNKFSTEGAFKEYIQSNLPQNFDIEYLNYTNEGKTHIFDIEIKDVFNKETEGVKMQIIMQLKEDRDFVMSFSIK